MVAPVEETTVQKFDLQFGTNVVGTRVVVYPFQCLDRLQYLLACNLQVTGYSQRCCCRHYLQPLTRRLRVRKRVS